MPLRLYLQRMRACRKLTKSASVCLGLLSVLLCCNVLVLVHIASETLTPDVHCIKEHHDANRSSAQTKEAAKFRSGSLQSDSKSKHIEFSSNSLSHNAVSLPRLELQKPVGSKSLKVLCWVLTSEANVNSRLAFVNRTWAKRCDVTLYFSDALSTAFPNVVVLDVPKGREHLTEKTFAALDYIFKFWKQDADWFLKADDDTYVLVENLRQFVHTQEEERPAEPVVLGHMLRHRESGDMFLSGGAGYVMNRAALGLFSSRPNVVCIVANREQAEDVDLARCMTSLGVSVQNALDAQGRSLFHPFMPEIHLYGSFPDWYREMHVGTLSEVHFQLIIKRLGR